MLHFAGPGTGLLPDLAAAAGIACKARTELPDTAIEVCACQNSMRAAGIEEAAFAPRVRPEPAAVAHLASGQFAAAAYVRI